MVLEYRKLILYLFLAGMAAALSGCATYHQKNQAFHQAIATAHYQEAVEMMDRRSSEARGRNRLLYHMEKGAAEHMAGEYAASNDTLEKAYIILDEFQRNYALETVSFITNPTVVPYPGEDFEKVQIHYYKAMNFALENNLDDARVECRRINIKLNEINDRYEAGKKNHYQTDAFAWNLMGLLFDASGDVNDAFICYRNALEAYESGYQSDYGLGPPRQLIRDLIRSAVRTGLHDEAQRVAAQYNELATPTGTGTNDTDVVIFWNNGLGPVKTEESINFFLDKGDLGLVTFVSEDRNFWLPVPVGGHDTNSFNDLSFVRMALPRYMERKPFFIRAEAVSGDVTTPLERAQDINGIALLNLQDRMGRELGKALLRLIIKQGIERAVRKEDATLGVIVSIVNAVTEQADTRNWQTLPHEIHYARIPVQPGPQTIVLRRSSPDGRIDDAVIPVDARENRTVFVVYHDPYSMPENPR
ncbi:hypothetical protein JXA80_13520 [bacterium]|nr:hypothetical protein [candidate division CSSED10-310 bacterium]